MSTSTVRREREVAPMSPPGDLRLHVGRVVHWYHPDRPNSEEIAARPGVPARGARMLRGRVLVRPAASDGPPP